MNKYRLGITNQTQINNLNYSIDPTFTKVNRLFVLSFKGFHVLTDGKSFFDMPIKNEEGTNKLLKREERLITQQVIYWIMNTF